MVTTVEPHNFELSKERQIVPNRGEFETPDSISQGNGFEFEIMGNSK